MELIFAIESRENSEFRGIYFRDWLKFDNFCGLNFRVHRKKSPKAISSFKYFNDNFSLISTKIQVVMADIYNHELLPEIIQQFRDLGSKSRKLISRKVIYFISRTNKKKQTKE